MPHNPELPETQAELVPTRLMFRASADLAGTIRPFSRDRQPGRRPEVRRPSPVFLFSRQVVSLDLGDHFDDGDTNDIAADEQYSDMIAERAHAYRFYLKRRASSTVTSNGDLELSFILNLTDYERRMLVGEPLFPEGFGDEIELYTRIPAERRVPFDQLSDAQKKIRTAMGGTVLPRSDDATAPEGAFVHRASVYHRWPHNQLKLPVSERE